MSNLSIRIDPELKRQLDSYARRHGVSTTTLLVATIKDMLDFESHSPSITTMPYKDVKKLERFVKRVKLDVGGINATRP